MPDDKVTVGEVASVTVSKPAAWRLVIGRFIVDVIETFTALAGAQLLVILASPPGSVEAWKVIAVQFLAPALSALISAIRRSWPAIRAWLLGEEGK